MSEELLNRAFPYQIKPTKRQVRELERMLRLNCDLYNMCLRTDQQGYKETKKGLGWCELAKLLTELRADENHQEYLDFSQKSQASVIKRYDNTKKDFFRHLQNGETPGTLRYKTYSQYNTILFRAPENGAKWDSVPTAPEKHPRLYVKGVDHIRVNKHREFKGEIKQIQITRMVNKWKVTLICGEIEKEILPKTNNITGVDMALLAFTQLQMEIKFKLQNIWP